MSRSPKFDKAVNQTLGFITEVYKNNILHRIPLLDEM